MRPVAWGVLSTAKIALEKVIPAMRHAEASRVVAIASRDPDRAREAAERLGIPKAYGSYDDMLADPEIEAVYNPLPNHLHLPWTIRAAEAGKHVLCEKPIALNAAETEEMIRARDRTGVRIEEAFMVRAHPQWRRARELVRSGELGELTAIQTFFSFDNRDPANIRNQTETGGGALYDIGCYAVSTARYLFGREPRRAVALVERDPEFGVDRLSSGILDFTPGQLAFTVGTQLVPWQRVQIFGTKKRIRVEIPFNAPNRAMRIAVDDGSALAGLAAEIEMFDPVDQYALQADIFSRGIRDGAPSEFPLEDALANMRALDALFRSAERGGWIDIW